MVLTGGLSVPVSRVLGNYSENNQLTAFAMQTKIKQNEGLAIRAHSFIGLAKVKVSLQLLEYVLYQHK